MIISCLYKLYDACFPKHKIQRAKLWFLVVLSYAVIMGLDWLSPMSIDYGSFQILYVTPAVLYASAAIFGWRGFDRTAIALESIAVGVLLTPTILMATYLSMALNLPLADARLAGMDVALGFDWKLFITWVDSHPTIATILDFCYNTFMVQLVFMPVLLCLFKMPLRGIAFVAAYAILCFISCIICIWYPALGTYSYYNIVPSDFPNIVTKFGYFFLEQFNAVRADPNFILTSKAAAGIVTFPSVHAGTACLLIWATWAIPYLRYPFLVVNLLMCVGALSQANHYLVDVIAGAGIAGLTVALVNYIFLNQPRTDLEHSTQFA